MKELMVTTVENDVRISSREVAKMMNVREHSKMIRKIESLSAKITEAKNGLSDYWIESKYIDSSGKSNKEYLISKKGCEFLALKSTGAKGVAFTIAYMNRFEEMKAKVIKIDSYMINDPIERAKAWILEQEEKQKLVNVIQIQAPKVEKYQKFMDSDGLISWDALSDILQIGKNKMLEHLRELRILKTDIFFDRKGKKKRGSKHNTPFATHEKYFATKVGTKRLPNGELAVKVFVKPAAVEYIEKKIKERIEYLEGLKRAN